MQPWVVRARLEGHCFDTNKCFILPAAVESQPGLSSAIDDVRRWLGEHEETAGLVVGHTDASGDPSYNDPLSLERAESFVAYLRHDVEHWLAWYGPDRSFEKRWGDREDRAMLEAICHADGLAMTADVVQAYQAGRGLAADGIIGPKTRGALVDDYMSLQDETTAVPDSLGVHGCGESFPRTNKVDAPGVDGVLVDDDATQRRVEVFLFDQELGVQPAPPGPVSAANTPEYPEWVRRARQTRQWSIARAHAIAVRVKDANLEPMPKARVILEGPATELEADSKGIVQVPFREGQLFREIRWGLPDGPEYQTTFFLEFDDDEEGLRRKLVNLGYPADEPVKAFQREFSRPETGNSADVRDEVHAWHDHGPPPQDDVTLTLGGGQKPVPGVSPDDATSKATVVGTDSSLVAGVAVGGKLATNSGTTITLTRQGQPPMTAVLDQGRARFPGLTPGAYLLQVTVKRSIEKGLYEGIERQEIHVTTRGTARVNVRIPLVTLRNAANSDAPHGLLEKGHGRDVLAMVEHAAKVPEDVAWSATGGLTFAGAKDNHLATIKGATTSDAVGSDHVIATQHTKEPEPIFKKCSGELLERMGRFSLPVTVAELVSIGVKMKKTLPLNKRDWFHYFVPAPEFSPLAYTEPKYDELGGPALFVMREPDRPVELMANTKPVGASVRWKATRNLADDDSLKTGDPTLEEFPTPSGKKPTAKRARLWPDQTGSFFLRAVLDVPESESPTPRGTAMAIVEVRVDDPTSVQALMFPKRWAATVLPPGTLYEEHYHGDKTVTEVEVGRLDSGPGPGTPSHSAMVAKATVTLISGGPEGRLGLATKSEHAWRVQLGWVNNAYTSDVWARYTNGHRVDVECTKKPGDAGDERVFLPGAKLKAADFVHLPLVDAHDVEGASSNEVALSSGAKLMENGQAAPPGGIGVAVDVTSTDAPALTLPMRFGDIENNGLQGEIRELHIGHTFRCFLCAWVDNKTLHQGRKTFAALAAFNWSLLGHAEVTASSPLVVTGAPTTTLDSKVDVFASADAKQAGCEVRGPGALGRARYVLK